MWIYRSGPEERTAGYIFPSQHERVPIADRIFDWAQKNPNAPINFWYDPVFVSEEEVENTQTLFRKMNEDLSRKPSNKISLSNLRQIPLVRDKSYSEVFSKATPTYFRADTLRLIATLHTLESCPQFADCYFVYSDLDVKPMDKAELFDDETLDNLNKFGLVFARDGLQYDMENSFHIVSKHKENLLWALENSLIKVNLERAKHALKGSLVNAVHLHRNQPQAQALSQIIYDSIPYMMMVYYHLEGLGKLKLLQKKVNRDSGHFSWQVSDYSHDPNSIEPFGTNKPYAQFEASFEVLPSSLYELIWDEEKSRIKIPTKKVFAPPAKGSGYY